MKSLTVNVEEELYRKLDRFVRRSGRTKNGLIVALLEALLERPPGLRGTSLHPGHPFWEMMGTLRDRATDVSENVDAYLHRPRRKA